MDTKESKELLSKATDFASRDIDLYTLVGADPSTQNPKDIHRAWRKSSLKYHPDKAGAAFDPDKWELLENARDVLLDAAARAAYDNGRKAQIQRQQERARMASHRKRLIDELEAAELEAKRKRVEEADKVRELERERMRLAEEGRRRMEEEAERFKKEQFEKERERIRAEIAAADDDEEDDERLQVLQARLDEVRRRKAEKKARKKGKGGSGDGTPNTGMEAASTPVTTNGTGEKAGALAGTGAEAGVPPKWEDLKAKMIAVQRRRDAEKLAKAQAAAANPQEV